MEVERLAEGLWRWTTRHPEWKQGDDWEPEVGCVYYEAPGAVVLIDPLVPVEPEERERFWRALDGDVARLGRPVAALLTVRWHERSAAKMVERYGGTAWRRGDDPDALPRGVEALPALSAEEVVFWLPEHGALVPGDVLLGDGKRGVRLCPADWLPAGRTLEGLGAELAPLLELPVELVLVSHGDPVLEGGREKLAAALAQGASSSR